ncbi:P-loop containing nucleoside triphosphate hydrolase protein [Crepidotus variabilis]|uniref:P-loop containing nucleoside triphosphate hydrolase protein n=1 Tax=Crepidotus variabilis TaxID=179855 RepID=A0A9P6ES10_9AGAR|nr:P-loop containing nucleoside triphosphate hydrolase protein [Crepidotus variabilis]
MNTSRLSRIPLGSEVVVEKNLEKRDIVIAIMGPTGSGKSNFIDHLSTSSARAGSRLQSVTEAVEAIRLRGHSNYQDRIVLVDTPGFDDTYRSDMEILQLIGEWLKRTYKSSIKLSGILYLHRISDNRMAGSPHRNLRMFGELCGDRAMAKVILVTTMWDRVLPEVGTKRENDLLANYWAVMTQEGAQTFRFKNTDDSAWEILDVLLRSENDRRVLLLQEEMVKMRKRLNETRAGMTLYADLVSLLEKEKKVLESIENADPSRVKQLQNDHARAQEEIEIIFRQLKKLKISFGRRVILFFKGDAKSHAVEIPDPR